MSSVERNRTTDVVLLRGVGRLIHGELWQSALARDLEVDVRTAQRWAAGTSPVPGGVWSELAQRVDARVDALNEARLAIETGIPPADWE